MVRWGIGSVAVCGAAGWFWWDEISQFLGREGAAVARKTLEDQRVREQVRVMVSG